MIPAVTLNLPQDPRGKLEVHLHFPASVLISHACNHNCNINNNEGT